MLNKFLSVNKLITPFSKHESIAPAGTSPAEGSSLVKIIHVGGVVECYYMPVPAVRIMEKYPSFLLARPEVFRRPWDSLVKPQEILLPGEKFYVVPRRTVQKLRRRIQRQPSDELSSMSVSFASRSSKSKSSRHVSEQKDGFSSKSMATHSLSKSNCSRVGELSSMSTSFSSRPPKVPSRRDVLEQKKDRVSMRSLDAQSKSNGSSDAELSSTSTSFTSRSSSNISSQHVLTEKTKDVVVPESSPARVTSNSSSEGSAHKSILSKTHMDNGSPNTVSSLRSRKSMRKRKVVMWNPTLTAIHEMSPAHRADD